VDEDNIGVKLLRFVKKGDLFGLQSILKKVKHLNIEKIYDDFGA
jgi:hypothetical protein